MSEVQLGSLLEHLQPRDAIHVAVISMIADEPLEPGQEVGIVGERRAGMHAQKIVGIVDPFLRSHVPKECIFWMFLIPGTVTGIRHHWSHPDFDDIDVPKLDEKERSEAWLRDKAVVLGVKYYDLVSEDSALENDDYINNGKHICDEWDEIKEEFWRHRKIVTGRDVPEHKRGGFTCSC